MTVAVKCNITSLVLDKINKLQWGFAYRGGDSILENYLEYLACPTIDLLLCNSFNCENPTIAYVCNLSTTGITYTLTGRKVTFSSGTITNGNGSSTYTYEWIIDTDIFDVIGSTTNNTLVVRLKKDIDYAHITTPITLHVYSSDGCVLTRYCYVVDTVIQCGDFTPCSNPHNLQIIVSGSCSQPLNLVVTNN